MTGIANVQPFNDFLPAEILCEVFKQSDFTTHSKAALVCKAWNVAMQGYLESLVACEQLIKEYQPRHAVRFLSMVPYKLENYCAEFAQKMEQLRRDSTKICQEVKNEVGLSKAKNLDVRLKSYNFLIEKFPPYGLAEVSYKVFVYGFLKINSASKNIPQENDKDLRGKTFVLLHYIENDNGIPVGLSFSLTPFGHRKVDVKFFPIELFQMKIKNGFVDKNQDDEIVCFVFEGRVIELKFDKEVVKIKPWVAISSSKIQTITLGSSEEALAYYAQNFYIPRIHALPQPSL